MIYEYTVYDTRSPRNPECYSDSSVYEPRVPKRFAGKKIAATENNHRTPCYRSKTSMLGRD